jgi:V/A-type H+-transporting ATPase subunit F
LSYEIAVVGDVETATGFALAGVRHVYIHERKDETLAKFDDLLANENMGLIITTHSIAGELDPEFKEKMRRKKLLPVVLKVPDKSGTVPEVDELYELIKRTVGTEVVVRAEEG